MNAIIVPAIIVAAIGLIAAIVLVIASKIMYVPVDERVALISEALPGANCGACGFPGCDGYAQALGEDPELAPNLCPVGGSSVATIIGGILGVEVGEVEPKTAFVMCNGMSTKTKQIMEADRIHDCKSAKMFFGGHWACTHGCLGLGDCQKECMYDAIYIVDGVAKVDTEACVGCGACTKACPNHVISIVNKKDKVHVACKSSEKGAITRRACTVGCIGCGKCVKACKFEAINVENNLAKVDYEKCKNCGLCAKECPTNAIVNLRKKKAPAKKPAAPAAE